MIIPTLLILFFLCWGSFLNVVAYRLIEEEHFFGYSKCTQCKHPIAWYDNIPIISYIVLQGRCRQCLYQISLLYPFIEIFTTVCLTLLYYLVESEYLLAYFIFFSALIVTIRTDFETMLISRWVTTALIPIGIIFSISDNIPIVPLNSILGAALGYFCLWLIGSLFYAITHKKGIGEGDFELLAMIGAFTGVVGVWSTILIGSILGSIIGIIYLKSMGILKRDTKLAFGPFLAFGAIIYILLQDQIYFFLMGPLN